MERKGNVSVFQMYRQGKTAAMGWGGWGEGRRRIGRKYGGRQRGCWRIKVGRV